jgi:hypothetical protein
MERSDAEILVCETCAQTFSSQEIMVTHVTEVHDEDPLSQVQEA